MTRITSASELKSLCSAAYQECRAETLRELSGVLCSRGRFVYVQMMNGEIDPRSEAEGWVAKFTQKELDGLLAEADSNPNISSIVIQGGLDWASCVKGFMVGDYDPLVATWSVTVFRRF